MGKSFKKKNYPKKMKLFAFLASAAVASDFSNFDFSTFQVQLRSANGSAKKNPCKSNPCDLFEECIREGWNDYKCQFKKELCPKPVGENGDYDTSNSGKPVFPISWKG